MNSLAASVNVKTMTATIPGEDEWHNGPYERAEPAISVHHGLLLDVLRNAFEEADQEPHLTKQFDGGRGHGHVRAIDGIDLATGEGGLAPNGSLASQPRRSPAN